MVNVGRKPIADLLTINFILNLVGIILTGVAVNKLIDGLSGTDRVKCGNNATIFFIPFALIATNVGIAAMLVEIHHLRVWRDDTLAAAAATQEVASMLSQCHRTSNQGNHCRRQPHNATEICGGVLCSCWSATISLYLLALRASTWTRSKVHSPTQNIV